MCVPGMGIWYLRYQIIPEGERLCVPVPCERESCPESLASRKLVCREAWSEGSETAKSGFNEQKLDTEAVQVG